MKVLSMIMGSIVLSVIGQLTLKTGVTSIAESSEPWTLMLRAFTTPLVWVGFGAYAIGAVLWLLVLSRVALSYAYPLVAVGYVLIIVCSAVILREQVSTTRWVAVSIICLGVALLARE